MDNFLPELLDDDPIDAAVESDDDDIDVSDVAPERVPDVKKSVRAKRAEHNKLLQKYGIHVWNHQQQYHVSFASNKCVITHGDKRENALYLRIRTPTADSSGFFSSLVDYVLADLLLQQLPVCTDPEDKSLVFDFNLTGKPAPNHTHVVYKRGTNSNDFLNRSLEEVSILEQTLYGAGTSRLPQLYYLEGRALPEEYFFGEQPPLTPSALADIGFRAESALAAWRNMVPQYSHMDIRLAELTLNGIFDKLQGIASTAMQQPTRSEQDQITGMQTSAQQPLMSLFGMKSLGTSDKAVGLRSAVHQYMGGSEIQTYSIMADADCLGKLIAGLVTRLNQVQLRTVSEQTRLLQLATPGGSSQQRPPARQELLLPRDFPLLCFLAIAGSGQAPQGFLLLLRVSMHALLIFFGFQACISFCMLCFLFIALCMGSATAAQGLCFRLLYCNFSAVPANADCKH
ncbi:TPA: hypothetical protein ACH3X1_016650 [Trebouxia sp. C0004]